MKIEVSIPDGMALKVAYWANRKDITIRELFCQALSDYVKGREAEVQDSSTADDSVTEALDAVYSREDSSLDDDLAMMQWVSLPVDWPVKDPTPSNPYPYCLCGCGVENTPKSRFKPGHDKKLESLLDQIKRGEKSPNCLPGVLVEAANREKGIGFKVVEYTAEDILSIAGTRVMKRGEIWCASLPEPSSFGTGCHSLVLIIQDNQSIDKALFTERVGVLLPETIIAVGGGLRLVLGL